MPLGQLLLEALGVEENLPGGAREALFRAHSPFARKGDVAPACSPAHAWSPAVHGDPFAMMSSSRALVSDDPSLPPPSHGQERLNGHVIRVDRALETTTQVGTERIAYCLRNAR
jgi:hypothetical protein